MNGSAWTVACRLAKSGRFRNVIEVEIELRRRGAIGEVLTDNTYLRELLTRMCHRSRSADSAGTDVRLHTVPSEEAATLER
jgi:hypothetical protein